MSSLNLTWDYYNIYYDGVVPTRCKVINNAIMQLVTKSNPAISLYTCTVCGYEWDDGIGSAWRDWGTFFEHLNTEHQAELEARVLGKILAGERQAWERPL